MIGLIPARIRGHVTSLGDREIRTIRSSANNPVSP